MKKMKITLAALMAIATIAAIATPTTHKLATNLYVAVYSPDGSNFTWQLRTVDGICVESPRNCKVYADSQPADNTTPPGTLPGNFQ